ncbi:MAG: anion permease [Candidatus Eisenbacteria sp.]|nr:anion permease [Candidatus Eisenbacteria bacterium]
MGVIVLILIGVAGLYAGWSTGANDAANSIGTSVGAGLMRYRHAVALAAVCVVAGAALQGHHVMETIGGGIVTDDLSPLGVLTALICSGLLVSIATFLSIPTSTSQAIVGSLAGVGVAAGLAVDGSKLLVIVQCWIFCPVLTLVLSYLILRLTRWFLRRHQSRVVTRTLTTLVVVSAGYSGYSLGANDVGNAIGPIAALHVVDMQVLVLIGGLALALGALTFGKGVTETVGKSLTRLDLSGAFSAQISAALGIHFFSMLGIPVSTSQAIVGGVLGVGVFHGIRTISRRRLLAVGIGWLLTPTIAGVLSFLLYTLLTALG